MQYRRNNKNKTKQKQKRISFIPDAPPPKGTLPAGAAPSVVPTWRLLAVVYKERD